MKNVIFVVGCDYNNQKFDFPRMCLGRLNYLIDFNKIAKPFRVTIFNFPEGKVDKYQVESNGSKKPIPNGYFDSDVKFAAITSSMYGEYLINCKNHSRDERPTQNAFKRNQFEVLSIINVFDYIIDIGSGIQKKSIIELSFFSHAYHVGPILVNSYDDLCDDPRRDYDDKDCRNNKDFNSTNLSDERKNQFRDAFDSKGTIWIYGCDMSHEFLELIKRIQRNYSHIDDETELKLVKVRDIIAKLIKSHSSISIAELNRLIENNRSYSVKEGDIILTYVDINVKFKYVKQMILGVLNGTYAGKIAKITNLNTYAAVLGTESELIEQKKYSTMRIKTKGYGEILGFYKKYLGMEFDPEGKYYANFLTKVSK